MHCRLANHHTQTDEPQVQISQVLTTYNGGSLIVEASVIRARVHCGGRRRCRPCIGPEHGAGLREPAQLPAHGRGRRERDLEHHGGGVCAELREPARGRLPAAPTGRTSSRARRATPGRRRTPWGPGRRRSSTVYNHATNTCSAPSGQSCGHYTQVVWRASTAIGCARVVCSNNAGVFIICNYYPPGTSLDRAYIYKLAGSLDRFGSL